MVWIAPSGASCAMPSRRTKIRLVSAPSMPKQPHGGHCLRWYIQCILQRRSFRGPNHRRIHDRYADVFGIVRNVLLAASHAIKSHVLQSNCTAHLTHSMSTTANTVPIGAMLCDVQIVTCMD